MPGGGLLAGDDDDRLALHLHDPFLYRGDQGQRWIDAAQLERLGKPLAKTEYGQYLLALAAGLDI